MASKSGKMKLCGPMDRTCSDVKIVGAAVVGTAVCFHIQAGRTHLAYTTSSPLVITASFQMYQQWLMPWQYTSRANGELWEVRAPQHLYGQQVYRSSIKD